MSFFDLAQKQLESSTFPKHALGPGYYHLEEKSRQKHSYAPFGSLSSKKQRKVMEHTLGPGNYEIRGEIVKPTVSRYENKNIIIVKINNDGGHQFKSKTNRFQSPQVSTVGPGYYESEQKHRRTKSTILKTPNINDKIRKINKEFLMKNQPTLASDPLQFQEQLPNKQPAKVKGVVSWGLNRKERFSIDINEQNNTQDKQRALSQIIQSRKTKIRPSAVFASKSIKSHIETQIYKTNNSFKAELRKMINYKDDMPGPGAYELHSYSNIKTPAKFQFFGSTAERFPDSNEQSDIGPGHYAIKDRALQLRENQFIHDRQRKEDRHSYIPTNTTEPGPGSYEVYLDLNQSYSQKKIENPFGSNKPRFPQEKKTEDQTANIRMEATSYCQEKRAKKELEIFHRKAMLQQHPYSIFASNSKRFRENSEQTYVGEYDVTQNDISSKALRYQKMAKQLQQCQLIKPPFLSSQQRFRKYKTEESEHKDCWCLIKSVQKQALERQSSAFACKQKREVFNYKNQAPPVGYYQSASKGIVKGSFNSRFRKKTQNQLKRDNILGRGKESGSSQNKSGLHAINFIK